MFTPFDALAATFYIFIVLLNAVSAYAAFYMRPEKYPQIWLVLDLFACNAAEQPLQILAIKAVFVYVIYFMGGFRE